MSQRPAIIQQLVDHRGTPIPPTKGAHGRQLALHGGGDYGWYGRTPYDAADIYGEHMALWNPYLASPDQEINFNRDRMVARMRDMVRNDGWASGGVSRILDNAIGAKFRPIFRPDYRALRYQTGLKTFDAQWASEFGKQADASYRNWASDPAKWCDIERAQTISEMCYTAFRHKLIDGEALAMMRYEEGRIGMGRARYATAVQLIDPDRLCNPNNGFDLSKIRGGVEIDDYGAAIAYHIREAELGDWFNAYKALIWKRVPRETSWGRPIIIHDFERERAQQHRGVGIFAPVLTRIKALVKYDSAELDSAIINSIFGAFIESPFDHAMLPDALGAEVDSLGPYQDGRAAFHKERGLVIGGVKIPTLYPGEKIDTVKAEHPNANYDKFQASVLRNIASATGLSAQQLSQNWADVNYSSARAAILEAWKTLDRRKTLFTVGFAHQIAAAWMEESFDFDDYELPAGAPDYPWARAAYSAARWIGPAKGWVDPIAEKQGAWLELKMGLSSLEDQAAEQGQDAEEVLDQQQIERQWYIARGLPIPDWMGGIASTIPSPPTVANQAAPQGPPAPKPTETADK